MSPKRGRSPVKRRRPHTTTTTSPDKKKTCNCERPHQERKEQEKQQVRSPKESSKSRDGTRSRSRSASKTTDVRVVVPPKDSRDASTSSSSSSSSSSSNRASSPAPKEPELDDVITVPEDTTIDPPMDPQLAVLQEMSENRVLLNVGGTRFETSKPTLQRFPKSILGKMVKEDSPFKPESSHMYFIYRDPSHFKLILNYMRNNVCFTKVLLPKDRRYLEEILLEARYYRLDGLMTLVANRIDDSTL